MRKVWYCTKWKYQGTNSESLIWENEFKGYFHFFIQRDEKAFAVIEDENGKIINCESDKIRFVSNPEVETINWEERRKALYKPIMVFSTSQEIGYNHFKFKDELFIVNNDKVAYKSGIEEYGRGSKYPPPTREKYFYIQLINGTRLYCRESEFDKI